MDSSSFIEMWLYLQKKLHLENALIFFKQTEIKRIK